MLKALRTILSGLLKRGEPQIASTTIESKTELEAAQAEDDNYNLIHSPEPGLVPYDENLLERARTQWQFGDWESLARLERDTLQHHPDRAKLALLAAAGNLQRNNMSVAQQLIRLAKDWGCSKKLVSQILIAGVHNNLGRAAAISEQENRALKHFESAIFIGTPGTDVRLLSLARADEQLRQCNISPLKLSNSSVSTFTKKNQNLHKKPFSGVKIEDENQQIIRTIHHLSCSGGTLLSKCIAAQPDVVLLNEIDPFSTFANKKTNKPEFSPRDVISLLQQSGGVVDEGLVSRIFCNDMQTVLDNLNCSGKKLVLREHAHGAYLIGNYPRRTPTLLSIIGEKFLLRSVVTVRNPIDSYLGMKEHGWLHFAPPTFEEYCQRYLQFLDSNQGIRIFKYEDFVRNPTLVMPEICDNLDLVYSASFIKDFKKFKFSGDSGRSGDVIEIRERRQFTPAFAEEVSQSRSFVHLTSRLGYTSDI